MEETKNESHVPKEECNRLIDTIFSDFYYVSKLDAFLSDEKCSSENKNWDDVSDQFILALEELRKVWNKIKDSNFLRDDVDLKNVFQVIYEQYPLLCTEAFPAVLFIFADSYYEFCDLFKNSETKNKTIPETFTDEQKEEIIDIFKCKIGGDELPSYLCSLIDIKRKPYYTSAPALGEKIFDDLYEKGKTFFEENCNSFDSHLSEKICKYLQACIKKNIKRM